jgi:PEP-CTERM motif-containing protein
VLTCRNDLTSLQWQVVSFQRGEIGSDHARSDKCVRTAPGTLLGLAAMTWRRKRLAYREKNMKASRYTLAAALGLIALVAARTAQADSIVYDVSGVFSGTATSLTGTVMFDSTTGLVTSASLSTTGSVPLGPFTFVLIQHAVSGNPSLDTVGIFDASFNDGVSLVFPFLSLFGFRSVVPLCGNSPLNCSQVGGFIISDFFTASTSYPLAQGTMTLTPEPSSLLLLGTGLLGLMAMTWRRKRLA